MRYLLQCVSGLQSIAAQQLGREGLGPLRFRLREEGLLVFDAEAPPRRVAALPYTSNCFLVIKSLRARPRLDMTARLLQLVRDQDWRDGAGTRVKEQERTFRIRLSDEGRPVAGDRGLVHRLASAVAEATGMRQSPRGAEVEFWVIRRRSGWAFLAKRISARERAERELARGELRPELAHLLCLMSEPDERDAFLDPFAGSGAIPFARAARPYGAIFAFDRDESKVRAMRRAAIRRPGTGPTLLIRVGEARRLSVLEDSCIDKVVTDPPWGSFDRSEAYGYPFYRDVLQEVVRVLVPGGIAVLLLGEGGVADQLIASSAPDLRCESRLSILVSGRKAFVVKWRRGPHRGTVQPSEERCDPI